MMAVPRTAPAPWKKPVRKGLRAESTASRAVNNAPPCEDEDEAVAAAPAEEEEEEERGAASGALS